MIKKSAMCVDGDEPSHRIHQQRLSTRPPIPLKHLPLYNVWQFANIYILSLELEKITFKVV